MIHHCVTGQVVKDTSTDLTWKQWHCDPLTTNQTTQHHIPEALTLQQHLCENLRLTLLEQVMQLLFHLSQRMQRSSTKKKSVLSLSHNSILVNTIVRIPWWFLPQTTGDRSAGVALPKF